MEFITPNLLEWWAIANSGRPCKELSLSVTLICAGAKHDGDADTTFEMFAIEESETDLLHVILGLHRQLIQASLSNSLDPETESTTRQRTLTLLNLEQPPNVSRSEHLALGVIYMLCNGYGQISAEGMDIIRGTTEDGHDMLHLAVLQGQTTLVREIARHSLAWFRSRDLTEESEIFIRSPNGDTALDYAKILGLEEIEHVLTETLVAALEFKSSTLQMPPRPLPTLPTTSRPGIMVDGAGSHQTSWIPPVPSQVLNRLLSPNLLISPYSESTELVATTAIAPPQRVQTAQAIIEDDFNYTFSHAVHQPSSAQINTVHYGIPTAASPERLGPATYAGRAPSHIEQRPSYEQYQYERHQPATYSETLHSIPPLRANSAPLPRPSNPQSQQPPQAIYQSSIARFRPLPATPHPPAAPLPPPRHKVTRVSRPRQFTVPTSGGVQMQSQPLPLQYQHTLAAGPVQQHHHHQYHPAPLQMPAQQHPVPMPTSQHTVSVTQYNHAPAPSMQSQEAMPMPQ
ncbi:hypothetical protein EDD21DRAFT_233677 [Dissophora ornata]|nr:hypothetical protein EDD21DRAFT_233677 [Dissophora ornata]